MADLSKMSDANLKAQMSKLKKIASRTDSAEAKAKFEAGISDIQKEIDSRKSEKTESKPKPKPKQRRKPKVKPEAKEDKEEKEDKPSKPRRKPRRKPSAKQDKKPAKPKGKRGVQMLSTRKVSVDGVEMNMNSQEFCDYLLAEFKERRIKAEERKSKKKKTKSVMAKVSDNIEKGISQAIKQSVKTNKAKIQRNPREFFGKVKKLETATRSFLNSLKSVLGKEFDGKEVTSTIKGIKDLVEELKKQVEK